MPAVLRLVGWCFMLLQLVHGNDPGPTCSAGDAALLMQLKSNASSKAPCQPAVTKLRTYREKMTIYNVCPPANLSTYGTDGPAPLANCESKFGGVVPGAYSGVPQQSALALLSVGNHQLRTWDSKSRLSRKDDGLFVAYEMEMLRSDNYEVQTVKLGNHLQQQKTSVYNFKTGKQVEFQQLKGPVISSDSRFYCSEISDSQQNADFSALKQGIQMTESNYVRTVEENGKRYKQYKMKRSDAFQQATGGVTNEWSDYWEDATTGKPYRLLLPDGSVMIYDEVEEKLTDDEVEEYLQSLGSGAWGDGGSLSCSAEEENFENPKLAPMQLPVPRMSGPFDDLSQQDMIFYVHLNGLTPDNPDAPYEPAMWDKLAGEANGTGPLAEFASYGLRSVDSLAIPDVCVKECKDLYDAWYEAVIDTDPCDPVQPNVTDLMICFELSPNAECRATNFFGAEQTCFVDPNNFSYVEMQIDFADQTPQWTFYTLDQSQAESDCNAMETCKGYWQRADTDSGSADLSFTLLFPGERTWRPGVPNPTVLLVMKKVPIGTTSTTTWQTTTTGTTSTTTWQTTTTTITTEPNGPQMLLELQTEQGLALHEDGQVMNASLLQSDPFAYYCINNKGNSFSWDYYCAFYLERAFGGGRSVKLEARMKYDTDSRSWPITVQGEGCLAIPTKVPGLYITGCAGGVIQWNLFGGSCQGLPNVFGQFGLGTNLEFSAPGLAAFGIGGINIAGINLEAGAKCEQGQTICDERRRRRRWFSRRRGSDTQCTTFGADQVAYGNVNAHVAFGRASLQASYRMSAKLWLVKCSIDGYVPIPFAGGWRQIASTQLQP